MFKRGRGRGRGLKKPDPNTEGVKELEKAFRNHSISSSSTGSSNPTVVSRESPSTSSSNEALSDSEIITKYWSYPEGKSVPAVVIYMNFFVDNDGVYIPCEIAMSSFTIENGITDGFCTLVDPGDNIPLGHGVNVHVNAEKFGLPPPPFPATLFRDYSKIVSEMEIFLKKFTVGEQEKERFIFCCSPEQPTFVNHLERVHSGMEWLYKQAGQKFCYRMISLETLLVVLTLGGLGRIVEQSNGQKSLRDLVDDFDTLVQHSENLSVSRMTSKGVDSYYLPVLSEMSGISQGSYMSIGKSGRRVRKAYQKRHTHPYAAFGGFMFAKQATKYLAQGDFLHMEHLACEYHQEKILMRGQEIIPGWCGPKQHLTKCALLRVRNILYLALDVVIVNYGVQGKKGMHYPEEAKK